MAGCVMKVLLVGMIALWIVGLSVSATLDSEGGFITTWVLGLCQSYAMWFAWNPILFWFKFRKEDQWYFREEAGGEEKTPNAALEKPDKVDPLPNDVICKAVDEWAGAQCCYGVGAFGSDDIKRCIGYPSYHYKFESFGECRHKVVKHKPYHGGPVDGGTEPGLWEVKCPPDQNFKEHEKSVKVPHSEEVKTCHVCHGTGKVRCSSCGGSGKQTRVDAEGRKHTSNCNRCSGSGQVKDVTCDGTGKLLWYKMLIAFFGAPYLEFIAEYTDLPDYLIKGKEGKSVAAVEDAKVGPLELKNRPLINKKSEEFVKKHSDNLYGDTRIRVLRQRHVVKMIPIWEVSFMPKDPVVVQKAGDANEADTENPKGDDEKKEPGEMDKLASAENNFAEKFYVFGENHEVFFPEYPSKCSFCCNCMDGNNCAVM